MSRASDEPTLETSGRAIDSRQTAELGAAIGRALASGGTLQAQLGRCAHALVGILDVEHTRIWTCNDAEQLLNLQASAGKYTQLDGHHACVPLGTNEIGRIAEERQAYLTNDVPTDPRITDREWADREGMTAFAGFPLLLEGRLIGAMALFAKQPLPEDVLQLLGSVTDMIAVGIERTRGEEERWHLLREEREAREELETIHRIAQMLSAELDLGRLVQAVTDEATSLSGAQFGAFFYNVIDARGESYTLYTLSGAPLESFVHFPTPRSTHIFGPTFRGEGVVRLDDVTTDPRYGQNAPYSGLPAGHLPVHSYLAVPVVSRSGEVLGGLFFGHAQPGVFTERSERRIESIAVHAAIAIDNARLYGQVQDAVRARDEFVAAAAHDLKTPLTSIKGMAQMLARIVNRSDHPDREHLRERATGIDETTTRMVRQIDEMLDITRLRLGEPLDLRLELVDVVELCREASDSRRHDTRQHEIVFSSEVSEVVGIWDATRLSRAIDNLVSNAIRYSPQGGRIDISVRRESVKDQDWAVIAVQDNGIGIPAHDLPRIFDRFQRASNVEGRIGGTGIGLASARQIVERHDGTISVDSQEGHGSTFTIRLPLSSPIQSSSKP